MNGNHVAPLRTKRYWASMKPAVNQAQSDAAQTIEGWTAGEARDSARTSKYLSVEARFGPGEVFSVSGAHVFICSVVKRFSIAAHGCMTDFLLPETDRREAV